MIERTTKANHGGEGTWMWWILWMWYANHWTLGHSDEWKKPALEVKLPRLSLPSCLSPAGWLFPGKLVCLASLNLSFHSFPREIGNLTYWGQNSVLCCRKGCTEQAVKLFTGEGLSVGAGIVSLPLVRTQHGCTDLEWTLLFWTPLRPQWCHHGQRCTVPSPLSFTLSFLSQAPGEERPRGVAGVEGGPGPGA